MKVQGTVALVTGAGAGTGREIAKRLAAEGAAVVVADLDSQVGQDTVRMIDLSGGISPFVQVDVASSDDFQRMVAAAGHQLSEPRILVNNAGGAGHVEPHFPDADPDQWQATLDLNLRGAMLATQLVLDPMQGARGGVVRPGERPRLLDPALRL